MNIFIPPSLDDLIRLLKAWKFWSLGALVGAMLGAVFYFVSPPPYRAQATVLVDFNMELAWPQETDRDQFHYLEREVRKLEDVAWADSVMQSVVEDDGTVTVEELRGGKLRLSQPAEGGWHFYAVDGDPRHAQRLASSWALAFEEQARRRIAEASDLSSFIEVEATQTDNLPVVRSVALGAYLFAGAVAFLVVAAIVLLFFDIGGRKND
jgi:capsular polysaccharide biosynthesis protein